MKKWFFLMGLLWTAAVFAAENNVQPVELAGKWASALASGDPQQVTMLYDKHAYVYPTFENKVDNLSGLQKYFKTLMNHPELKVHFSEQHLRVYDETAVNSGFYEFSYLANDKEVVIPARYTFVYLHESDGWKIVEHHSSVLPSSSQHKPRMKT